MEGRLRMSDEDEDGLYTLDKYWMEIEKREREAKRASKERNKVIVPDLLIPVTDLRAKDEDWEGDNEEGDEEPEIDEEPKEYKEREEPGEESEYEESEEEPEESEQKPVKKRTASNVSTKERPQKKSRKLETVSISLQ